MMNAPTPRVRGFTLIELMVTLAITGILLMTAVPQLRSLLARLRLEGAVNELSTDLQYARTEALRRKAQVSLVTSSDGASYWLVVGDPPPACDLATNCLKMVALQGVTLTPSITVSYESLRGLLTNDGAALTGSVSGSTAQLRINLDAMGRVQMCSPSASMPGYPSC